MSLKLQLRMKTCVAKILLCHNHAMLYIIIVVNLFICLYEIHFCYSKRCQRTRNIITIESMLYIGVQRCVSSIHHKYICVYILTDCKAKLFHYLGVVVIISQ